MRTNQIHRLVRAVPSRVIQSQYQDGTYYKVVLAESFSGVGEDGKRHVLYVVEQAHSKKALKNSLGLGS